MKITAKTGLLLIDVQKAFDDPKWGPRNNLHAEANIGHLLSVWREKGLPVFHIRHLSRKIGSLFHPDADSCAFKPEAHPLKGEPIIEKYVNSAFIGTDLEERLRGDGIQSLVIAGLTTDHCVSTTTRMAGNLGFDSRLLSDATATFDREDLNGYRIPAAEVHRIHLASLHGEFTQVTDTHNLIAHL